MKRSCLAISLIVMLSGLGFALPPESVPKGEVRDFTPSAGYLRSMKQLQLLRRAAANAAIPLAPGQPLALRGTRSIPVICVEFNNVGQPFPAANYETKLFGPAAFTMTSYYKAISQGRFNVSGKVLGWYHAPKNDTFYEGNNNGLGGAPFGELLQFAFAKADQDTDFGQFDNDGPDGQPNSGDDDGIVDTIFVIHPEIGGECRNPLQLNNIWSHSWHYSQGLGHAGSFVTNDPVRDASGVAVPGSRILIEDYTIQPGLACASTATAKKIIEIGVFCHEYGHALGLPDLYDRTPNGSADSEGIGNWCLMAGGSYGGDGAHADRPCRMSAWPVYYLGWADVQSLVQAAAHNFSPVDVGNTIYRFNVPGTDKLEYFLFEFRRQKDWDQFIPAAGLAIWHIDERVGEESPAWPFSPPDQGQNDSRNHVGAGPKFEARHQLVALVQSDRKMELENNVNRGDAGDLFGQGAFTDDAKLVAGSRAYDGAATNLNVKNIAIGDDQATAAVDLPAGIPVGAPPAPSAVGDLQFKPSAEEKQSIGFLEHAAATLESKQPLSNERQKELAATAGHVIKALSSDESRTTLRRASGQLRTETVGAASKPETTVQTAVKSLVDSNMNTTTCQVRFTPNRQGVEQIAGLSVPIGDKSTAQDAKDRVHGDMKPLFGESQLIHTEQPVKAPSQVHGTTEYFQQVIQVDDQALPVFGKQVSMHYQNKMLTAAMANLAHDTPTVSGKPGSLSTDTAKDVTAKLLGTPRASIAGGQEGVFLVGDNPNQGRVAVKVLVPAGIKQRPLEVYVDSQTQRILSIR